CLADDGVVVLNMNMISDGENGINSYLSDTIAQVFPYIYTADVAGNTNRELFASSNPEMINNFKNGYASEKDENLANMMAKVDSNLVEYKAGNHILTDDKAPVELLSINAIDQLIRDEVGYYKEVYKEEGLEGLLKDM
ncbi:MAG: spermidine synthase, partial [Eubacterium sp.]|nr:spermidine synthase [Eubacterium sp.]